MIAQAKECRSQWKEELWESEDIEKFGYNEYVGGEADAYEDCLDELKKLVNEGHFMAPIH